MQLPDEIIGKIESLIEGKSLSELSQTVKELSNLYRQNSIMKSYMQNEKDFFAYLLFRLPATFAAVNAIFQDLKKVLSHEITSLIDIGSGPGTATIAALENFDIKKGLLLEKEQRLIDIAKSFVKKEGLEFSKIDFRNIQELPNYDLAVFSYSIGEVVDWQNVIDVAFKACKTLVVIEPGTPRGFERIKEIRNFLIEKKAFLLAPCPHNLKCPVKEDNWCHFYTRLCRNKWHKDVKGAELGWEDEKFSYIIASKVPGKPYDHRIVLSPKAHRGHITVDVCSNNGSLQTLTVSKKNKDLYKSIKKKDWGDFIDLSQINEVADADE